MNLRLTSLSCLDLFLVLTVPVSNSSSSFSSNPLTAEQIEAAAKAKREALRKIVAFWEGSRLISNFDDHGEAQPIPTSESEYL